MIEKWYSLEENAENIKDGLDLVNVKESLYQRIVAELDKEKLNEKAIVTQVENDEWKVKKGDIVIEIDKRYFRPTEVDLLIGDATKARTKLGWSPKHNLDDLIQDMMDADIKLFKKDILLNQSGFTQNRQFE
mgnify:CR=1 FL=1